MNMSNSKGVKPQGCAAGFTLLEVLVAVALVALVLVSFMGLHLRSLDATLQSQDITTAVLLAQGKLASLGSFPETGTEEGAFEGPDLSRFRWASAVTEHTLDAKVSGGKAVVVRQMDVTILWLDGQQTRSYVLEAYGLR